MSKVLVDFTDEVEMAADVLANFDASELRAYNPATLARHIATLVLFAKEAQATNRARIEAEIVATGASAMAAREIAKNGLLCKMYAQDPERLPRLVQLVGV